MRHHYAQRDAVGIAGNIIALEPFNTSGNLSGHRGAHGISRHEHSWFTRAVARWVAEGFEVSYSLISYSTTIAVRMTREDDVLWVFDTIAHSQSTSQAMSSARRAVVIAEPSASALQTGRGVRIARALPSGALGCLMDLVAAANRQEDPRPADSVRASRLRPLLRATLRRPQLAYVQEGLIRLTPDAFAVIDEVAPVTTGISTTNTDTKED